MNILFVWESLLHVKINGRETTFLRVEMNLQYFFFHENGKGLALRPVKGKGKIVPRPTKVAEGVPVS